MSLKDPPSFFSVLQQNGCSKSPKGSPFLHFSTLRDLPETSKGFRIKFWNFFPHSGTVEEYSTLTL